MSYGYRGVAAWYVAGPLGLEQGFTLSRRPAGRGVGPLAVALSVRGSLSPRLSAGGRGLVLVGVGGGVVLRYGGLSVRDARGRVLRSWLSFSRGRLVIRVLDAGAVYRLRVDPFIQTADLTVSGNHDRLGTSVAMTGEMVVAGAPNATVGSNHSQGAVYVFTRAASGWSGMLHETARLTASDGAAGDSLGSSVAVSGRTVVAGAPDAKAGATFQQGASYVFVEPAGGWSGSRHQAAKLTALHGSAGDQLGVSVGVSGNTVVAGAPNVKVGRHGGQGTAYVFSRSSRGWVGMLHEAARLRASDGGGLDQLGYSVAISGQTVVAGAPYPFPCEGFGSAVYVFTRLPGGWSGTLRETAKLTASDGGGSDGLGASVAISGQTVVAGAPLACDKSGQAPGTVYVFTQPAGGWSGVRHQAAELTDFGLGGSVAVSGQTVVAGFGAQTLTGLPPSGGAALVFREPAGGWSGTLTGGATLTASDGGAKAGLGNSVAVSGQTVIAGAPFDPQHPTAPGAVYVFSQPAAGWSNETEAAKLTAADSTASYGAGPSVAISGRTIFASGSALSASHFQGVVYAFSEPAGGWSSETQAAMLVASDRGDANGFGLGESLAVSGQTVVAANFAAGSELPARGAVYVFTRPPGGWSGTVHETAKLTASDGAPGDRLGWSVAISGQTIVAGAPLAIVGSHANQGAVYVFTEPPGGWMNATQAAKLTTSQGATDESVGYSVALSGHTVLAGTPCANFGSKVCQGAVFAFTEPSGGWSGTMHEVARLTASDGAAGDSLGVSVAVSGQTVVAGAYFATVSSHSQQGAIYVFTRPAGGWFGTRHQAAKLTTKLTPRPDQRGDQLGQSVAASGQTIVAGAPFVKIGQNANEGAAYVFTEPAGGWSGTLHEATELIASTGATNDQQGSSVAVSGQTVIVGGGNAVRVFSERKQAGLPTASKVSLGGLATGKARLSFNLRAGANAPRIESFTVSLPRGLNFSQNNAQLGNGLAIVGAAKYTLSLSHGKLRVALSKPVDGLSVRIGGQALSESKAFLNKAKQLTKFNADKKHHKTRTLNLNSAVRVTDTTRKTTQLVLRLIVR